MKRQGGGGDTVQPRSNSGTTRISSGATSTTLGTDPQLLNNLQSSKIITEVDGMLIFSTYRKKQDTMSIFESLFFL